MYSRHLLEPLKSLATKYPVIALVGPRQSGKSTLSTLAFPEYTVVNLERPDIRARIAADPQEFISSQKGGCIIDEIQYLPELASYIQVEVDKRKSKGEFIITGSQQYQLMQSVSQSLAGRVAIVRLLPMSSSELRNNQLLKTTIDERMLFGGYPRIYHDELDPSQALGFYVQTYIERDIRLISAIQDLGLFEKFMRLCATRCGQLFNATSLSNDVGVDQSTIKRWISILETGFIIKQIQPHHDNLGKRLIKSPKLFFYDTGLLCHLLGITNASQLASHPLRGAIFENYVASELFKLSFNRVEEPRIYFFRDRTGHEIDFLIEQGSNVMPIEVKSSTTFSNDFLKQINFYNNLPGSKTNKSTILYTGEEQFSVKGCQILPINNIDNIFN